MTRIREKIIKLLRLAQDREGSPEGDLAQKMADRLISQHDITIDADEVSFEAAIEVEQYCVAESDERVWWMEMLLVTLCDVYGGEAISMMSSTWRLYVVREPNEDEDVKVHFDYLHDLVHDLQHACASEFMQASPAERDSAISSFCIGVVHRIAQLLYAEDRDLETMPFMVRALGPSNEDVTAHSWPSADLRIPSWTSTDLSVPAWQSTDLHDEPEIIEVVPDWSWFDRGYLAAKQLVRQIHPPS